MESPNYIQSLLIPTTRKPQGRRVWSIDLEQVWLSFFTATNTMGDTANLLNYAGSVIKDNAEGYKTQVALARKAGEPIYQHDRKQLDSALKAKAVAEARAVAEGIAKAEAKPKSKAKELVHA